MLFDNTGRVEEDGERGDGEREGWEGNRYLLVEEGKRPVWLSLEFLVGVAVGFLA
jgi:hypothetical protein